MPVAKSLGAVLGAGLLASGSAPFLEKMPDIFGGIASKGKGAADSIGSIASKVKGLGGNVNLTNFAKGFETVRGKIGGLKVGMTDMEGLFGMMNSGFLKVGGTVTEVQDKFPRLTKTVAIYEYCVYILFLTIIKRYCESFYIVVGNMEVRKH